MLCFVYLITYKGRLHNALTEGTDSDTQNHLPPILVSAPQP